MSRSKKDWTQDLDINKGGLHRSLGIPMDKKIPAKRLDKATHSRNPLIKKQAVLAKNFSKAKHN